MSWECSFDENGYCYDHADVVIDGRRCEAQAALCTYAAAALQARVEAGEGHRLREAEARVRELEGQGADPVAYPNFNAVIDGRVSADAGQWPQVRVELRALLARLSRAEATEGGLAARIGRLSHALEQANGLIHRFRNGPTPTNFANEVDPVIHECRAALAELQE